MSVTCRRQVCGFLRVLRFPPPIKLIVHDITEILLKVALNTINLNQTIGDDKNVKIKHWDISRQLYKSFHIRFFIMISIVNQCIELIIKKFTFKNKFEKFCFWLIFNWSHLCSFLTPPHILHNHLECTHQHPKINQFGGELDSSSPQVW